LPRALITDLAGTTLCNAEREFLKSHDPLGIILFSRNIENTEQLFDLTSEFRTVIGRPDAPVLIDQEGGRIARLREPRWWSGIAPFRLGIAGEEAAWLAGRLLAADMASIGVDVDCAPCLDLRVAGMHDVIGDRAFGETPDRVVSCARAYSEGLEAGGVQPMIKHLPGHGRVGVDPHDVLPVADADLETLRDTDFKPFQALKDLPWGMTAHVVYRAIDDARPATQSPSVINDIIRGEIGFDGVLTSDAIDMQALSGSHPERARLSLEAGCDIVMHCNQPLESRIAVADVVPELSGEALRRVNAALSRRTAPKAGFDRAEALSRLEHLLVSAGA